MKKLTKEQVNTKYRDRYVEFYKDIDNLYEIRKVYKEIHENTSLGQDIGTEQEYTR